jgi:hypothetical protein
MALKLPVKILNICQGVWQSLMLLGLFILLVPQARATDWEDALQKAQWTWTDSSATLNTHIRQHFGGYGVRVSGDAATGQDLLVDFTRRGKTVLRQKAHNGSAFVAVDDTLFWADYLPTASGCRLQSYSLETGLRLWSTSLKGLGPVSHSKYANAVRLEVQFDTIWVWSHESSGDYVEVVDQATGKTLANRVFRK